MSVSGKYGGNAWNCRIFDPAEREEGGTVLLARMWVNNEAGFGFMQICESTGTGSFTYDPESGKSRILAFGITDAEQAEIIYKYAHIEEQQMYEKRMAEYAARRKELLAEAEN